MLGMHFVPVPLIEEHMTQTRPYQRCRHHPYQQREQPLLGSAVMFEHLCNDVEAQPEAYGEHHAVPAYLYKRINNHGIDIPDYVSELRYHFVS